MKKYLVTFKEQNGEFEAIIFGKNKKDAESRFALAYPDNEFEVKVYSESSDTKSEHLIAEFNRQIEEKDQKHQKEIAELESALEILKRQVQEFSQEKARIQEEKDQEIAKVLEELGSLNEKLEKSSNSHNIDVVGQMKSDWEKYQEDLKFFQSRQDGKRVTELKIRLDQIKQYI